MNENEDYLEIDLKQIFYILWNRAWIIVSAGIVAAAIAFGWTYFFVTPLYQSSTTLYVNNININSNATGYSSTQLQAAQGLASTYMVILESKSVIDEVIEQTELPYTYEQVKSMVSASSVNETEIFKVVVTNPDPTIAADIANAIADILPGKIAGIVEGSSVRVVDYADVATNRSYPSYKKNTAIGMLIGLVVSAGIIVLIHLLSESITSEEYLTRTYPEIPLLAVIPDAASTKSTKYYKSYYGTGRKPKVHSGQNTEVKQDV